MRLRQRKGTLRLAAVLVVALPAAIAAARAAALPPGAGAAASGHAGPSPVVGGPRGQYAGTALDSWRRRLSTGTLESRLDVLLRLTTQEFLSGTDLIRLGEALEPAARSDADRAIARLLRCRGYYRLERTDEAHASCTAAEEAARRSDSPRLVAESLRLDAYLDTARGSPEHALLPLHESLERAKAAQDAFGAAAALNGLGVAAFVGGALAEAERYYFDALERLGPEGDVGLRAVIESNLGYMYLDTGRYAQAHEYLSRSLRAAERAANAALARGVRAGLAEARAALGRTVEALAEIRRLAAELHPDLDPLTRCDVYIAGARVALRAGDPALALEYARLGESASREANFRRTLVGLLAVDALLRLQRPEDAAREAAALRGTSGAFAVLAGEVVERQAVAARALGDVAGAARYEREADALRASIARGRAGEQASFVSARLAADLQASELARTRALQDAAEAAADRARLTRNVIALAALVLLLAGALAWWMLARRREAAARVSLEREVERRTHELEAAHERRRELELAVDRQRRLEAIGRLTGGVAHDYNNLMTIVRQCGDILLLRPAVAHDTEAVALVNETVQAATAAGDLSQRLLAFAKQRPVDAAPLALGSHFDEIRSLLERACGAERRFDLQVEAGEPRVLADPGLLTSVLINLVANARDATRAGGSVSVDVRRRIVEEAAAARLALAPGRYVAIDVRDDGDGMSPEVAERAIEPFFTTKGPAAGTGLGLSIAHGFATAAGGALRITTSAGRGTTITLLLPEVADGR